MRKRMLEHVVSLSPWKEVQRYVLLMAIEHHTNCMQSHWCFSSPQTLKHMHGYIFVTLYNGPISLEGHVWEPIASTWEILFVHSSLQRYLYII